MRFRLARAALCLAALALARPVRPARAQSDARVLAALRTAQEGNLDSARGTLDRLLRATVPTDSAYPELLYGSALLAASAADQRQGLTRVLAEYPLAPVADDALLRLLQLDVAGGDADGALRQAERFRTDYGTSPLLPQVALFAARAAFAKADAATGCRWVADGLARVGDDVEARNALDFYRPRCERAAAAPAESSQAAPADTGAPAAGWWVQVVAANTQAAADQALAKARKAGFRGAVAREGGFFKVRLGPYASRAEAQAAAPRVKAKLGGAPFVTGR